MAWVLADIKGELHAMAVLLQARSGVPDLEKKLCASLKDKLSKLPPLSSADLVLCYDSLKEAQLPETVYKDILAALDQLAVGQINGGSIAKLTSSAQECVSFQKYLTAQELSELDQVSMWEGCHVIAKRLRLLGILGMKETLKKRALTVLVWHENKRTNKIPCLDLVYSLCAHLLDCFQLSTVEVPAGALTLAYYPEDPFHLEKAHLEASYSDGKPGLFEYPRFSLIMQKHVRVRSTATGLSKDLGICLCIYV